MKTLADMTPQERAECRGRWGQHRTWGLVIISTTDGIQSRGINVEIVRFLHDGRPLLTWEPTDSITLRDDLPRAWQADGTPPAGEWQTASQSEQVTPGSIWDLTTKKTPTHRRFIGEWETA